jgi:hypothetical protein
MCKVMYFIRVIRRTSVLLLIIISVNLHAQNLPSGAQAAGLGFATVALEGRMGVWSNAAGLSTVRNRQILSGYENRYGLIEGLHAMLGAYLHPFRQSAVGVSFYRFGDDIFSQHKLSLSAGHQMGQFSGGLRLNQHQYSMEGADTRFALAIDVGAMMRLSSQLRIGMQISNISQARVSRQTGERIPSILSVGINYQPDQGLNLLAEVTYELDYTPTVKVGLEYQPAELISLRSGVNSGPQPLLFMGLGLRHRVIHFDYALEMHQQLGVAQHIGLAYQFLANAQP